MDELSVRLGRWLAEQVGGPTPMLSMRPSSSAAGFSGQTILFDVHWDDEELPSGAYALKTPPVDDPHPLFPRYDLRRQVDALRLVGEHTDAPVPTVQWWSEDAGPLGCPFMVMTQVSGEVASDMPPYTFGGWVHELSDRARTEVERSFIRSMAAVHVPKSTLPGLEVLHVDAPGATALERHVALQRAYYDWIRGDHRFPLVEAAFTWLEDRWPAEGGSSGIVWGDARLANAMFRDAEVVGLLDWEAAAIGPPEIDLSWAIYFADYFQRIAVGHGFAGLPRFMVPTELIHRYRDASGREPVHLEWHLVYAALRQGLTSIRVTERAVLRNQQERPADQQDLIADRRFLEDLVEGRSSPDLVLGRT